VDVSLGTDLSSSLSIADNTTGLGLVGASAVPVPGTLPVRSVKASGADAFLQQSTAGGAVTGYASNGSPANLQLRWAETATAATDGTDTWNLYCLSNNAATGAHAMWTNVGVDYKFAASGALLVRR
jgi:flagellar hook protein FlgE